jgi:hypothetical protein
MSRGNRMNRLSSKACCGILALTVMSPGRQGAGNKDGADVGRAPCDSDVALDLVCPAEPQARQDPVFDLTVTNRSGRELVIDNGLSPYVVIFPDIRDERGHRIALQQGPTARVPISPLQFGKLDPLGRVTKRLSWRQFYLNNPPIAGILRVRFLYDTTYAAGAAAAHGLGVWRGAVLSNTVAVKVTRDSVRVLGSWHRIRPLVALSCLRRDCSLAKVIAPRESAPEECCLHLESVLHGVRHRVVTTTQLQGLVNIQSRRQALEYVRLFTDLDTHYLFADSNILEVHDDVAAGEPFGLMSGFLPEGPRRLRRVAVARTARGFRIERDLATYPRADGKSLVIRVVERVSKDGKYQRTVVRVIAECPPNGEPGVLLPYY